MDEKLKGGALRWMLDEMKINGLANADDMDL